MFYARLLCSAAVGFIAVASAAFAQGTAPHPAQTEYFEKNVRPLLVKNCQGCHNAKLKSGGLDLSTAGGFVSGNLVNKEKPESSRILVVTGYEGSVKMPPMGKLKAEDLATLTEWVKMGAPYPGAEQVTVTSTAGKPADFTPEQKAFWAFQKVKDVAPPPVQNKAWVKSPIDQFILAKLEEHGLKPAPPADKVTLLRRVTLDLTGLPPTPEEIAAFQADKSPEAFEKVVDRLLASPRYGERWGRHWLDVARYADSTGNDEDHRYPYAYRYRDYVIQSFNDDVPYNQFVREQLAGDLLPGQGRESFNKRGIVATGFLALGAKAIAQQDKKKMLYDIYDEQVDVVSKSFLGLTVACARCHNHKFDPILTRDYYSLTGMFASTRDFTDAQAHVSSLLYRPLVPEAQYKEYQRQQNEAKAKKFALDDFTEDQIQQYSHTMVSKLAAYLTAARDPKASAPGLDPAMLRQFAAKINDPKAAAPWTELKNAAPDQVPAVAQKMQAEAEKSLAGWDETIAKWRDKARQMAKEMNMPPPDKPKFDAKKDPFTGDVFFGNGPMAVPEKDQEKVFSADARARIAALKKDYEEYKAHAMPEPEMADAVEEGQLVAQKVFVRGDLNNPGEDAPRAVPAILSAFNPPKEFKGSGRLDLANWLVDPENPLTARVMVNRIWSWHFGEGIVRTPDNFGRMGDRPSHPELLDYLARQFVKSGWSIKKMQRMMLLSSTYQMASDGDEKSATGDVENRLLTRFNRQRMDVEEIRDGMLFIAGKLDATMGGTLQTGFGTDSENSEDRLSMNPEKIVRRTVYVPLRRANLPTLLNLFDFGDATTVNGRRSLTNVAPQALFMMNSTFVEERSADVAKSVMAHSAAARDRLDLAFLKILNRAPSADEADNAMTYINQLQKRFQESEAKAWRSFCQVLFSSNEYVYVD